ncbi:MAG: hypothetical protein RXS42_09350 [Nitrososphaeria archaeon]
MVTALGRISPPADTLTPRTFARFWCQLEGVGLTFGVFSTATSTFPELSRGAVMSTLEDVPSPTVDSHMLEAASRLTTS